MKGFTLIELLIVILIIGILAGLIIPAAGVIICQGRETQATSLIRQIDMVCRLYEKDHNIYPPTDASFNSGPVVQALSGTDIRGEVYFPFSETQLMSWPITDASHLRNPVDRTLQIRMRDNTRKFPGGPPVRSEYGMDIWAEGCDGVPTSMNNWNQPE